MERNLKLHKSKHVLTLPELEINCTFWLLYSVSLLFLLIK